MTLSNSQITKLGDRLRDSNISDDDLKMLDSFRQTFSDIAMYYLIEHNRITKATQWAEYIDYPEAQAASLQKEQQYFLANKREMEVVVFEANSIDDLKRTHSRYFVADKQKDDTAGALLAVGLVGLAIYLLNKK